MKFSARLYYTLTRKLKSQTLTAENSEENLNSEELPKVLVSLRWPASAREVFLCHDRDWSQRIPLSKSTESHWCIEELPVGTHYRFQVDGEYKIDPLQPTTFDECGQPVNILEVGLSKLEDEATAEANERRRSLASYGQDFHEFDESAGGPPSLPPQLIRHQEMFRSHIPLPFPPSAPACELKSSGSMSTTDELAEQFAKLRAQDSSLPSAQKEQEEEPEEKRGSKPESFLNKLKQRLRSLASQPSRDPLDVAHNHTELCAPSSARSCSPPSPSHAPSPPRGECQDETLATPWPQQPWQSNVNVTEGPPAHMSALGHMCFSYSQGKVAVGVSTRFKEKQATVVMYRPA